MKIIKSDLPESYLKLLEKALSKNICVGLSIPEHVRLEIRDTLRHELIAGELEIEPKDNDAF